MTSQPCHLLANISSYNPSTPSCPAFTRNWNAISAQDRGNDLLMHVGIYWCIEWGWIEKSQGSLPGSDPVGSNSHILQNKVFNFSIIYNAGRWMTSTQTIEGTRGHVEMMMWPVGAEIKGKGVVKGVTQRDERWVLHVLRYNWWTRGYGVLCTCLPAVLYLPRGTMEGLSDNPKYEDGII